MAAITVPFSATYRDARGFTGKVKLYITGDDGTPDDMLNVADLVSDAIVGLSNAAEQSTSGLDLTTVSGLVYGATGQYQAAYQKAAFPFTDSVGSVHTYLIPAPKQALFLADLTTIDVTNAQVVTFVGVMTTASGTAFVSSRQGKALVISLGGKFIGKKEPKRLNVKLKSATLVTGEEE